MFAVPKKVNFIPHCKIANNSALFLKIDIDFAIVLIMCTH